MKKFVLSTLILSLSGFASFAYPGNLNNKLNVESNMVTSIAASTGAVNSVLQDKEKKHHKHGKKHHKHHKKS